MRSISFGMILMGSAEGSTCSSFKNPTRCIIRRKPYNRGTGLRWARVSRPRPSTKSRPLKWQGIEGSRRILDEMRDP